MRTQESAWLPRACSSPRGRRRGQGNIEPPNQKDVAKHRRHEQDIRSSTRWASVVRVRRRSGSDHAVQRYRDVRTARTRTVPQAKDTDRYVTAAGTSGDRDQRLSACT